MEEWRLIPFERCSAYENMAIDEAILGAGKRGKISPTLRLYGWRRPAVSLGYFQDLEDEVNGDFCRRNKIDIVRRPTGGKAVFHDGDLTYSFVAHERHPRFSSSIMETYSTISECIIRGLEKAGIGAVMAKEGRGDRPGALKAFCFSVPLRHELLVGGKKICGSAQVRSKGVFLQHGSILLDFDPDMTARIMAGKGENPEGAISKLVESVTCVNAHREDKIEIDLLCRYITEGFQETMNVRLVGGGLTPREETLKQEFLKDKYLNPGS